MKQNKIKEAIRLLESAQFTFEIQFGEGDPLIDRAIQILKGIIA